MLRLKVGDVEIEVDGSDKDLTEYGKFEWLLEKVEAVRNMAHATSTPNEKLIRPVGERIRRTKDEMTRGLSIEEAIAERVANGNPSAGASEENKGEAFKGELNLEELNPEDL